MRLWRRKSSEYLKSQTSSGNFEPQDPIHELVKGEDFQVEWAVFWALENKAHYRCKSYVNLIPTVEGGTHVNGFRFWFNLGHARVL